MTMTKAVIDYFKFYDSKVGPRLTALQGTRALAAERGDDPELVSLLDAAIAADEALFAMEQRWQQRKRYKVRHGERAIELDRDLDRLLAAFEGCLSAQAALEGLAGERAALAARAHGELFPAGLGAITKARFGDQAHATRLILRRIDGEPDFLRLIQELGLSEQLELIRGLNAEYSAEISAARPPRFDELQAARRAGQTRLGRIVLHVLARFPEETEADIEARMALLAPIETQDAERGAFYRDRVRRKDEGEAEGPVPEAA